MIPLTVDVGAERSAVSSGSKPVRAQGFFYEIPAKSAGCCDLPCTEAFDSVRICNVASRNGVGDLVWLGWQASAGDCKAKRSTHINFGTALVALTVRGGKTLADAMADGRVERGHIDVSLKNFFLKEARTARASYIIPPIGGSIDHESACDPQKYGDGKRRPSIWQCDWLAQGTRRSEDRKNREKWLALPVEKGQAQYICKADVDDDTVDWRTYIPTETGTIARAQGGRQANRLPPNTLPVQGGECVGTKRRKREVRASKNFLQFRTPCANESEVTGA